MHGRGHRPGLRPLPDPARKALALRRVVVLLAASAALGLWTSQNAFAAYDPSLLLGEASPALGGGGSIRIFLQTSELDDATGTVTVYSPRGYRVELGHPPGTVLGTAIVFVKIGASGTRQAAQGRVRTDNPANHAGNSCSPGTHEAVWLIEFALVQTTYRLPIYIDRTSGSEAAFASAGMRLCSDSPYAATARSVSLGYADLTIGGVFRNPSVQGTYAWNALFVPYTPGTGTLNAALTAQSTSYVGVPAIFSVTAKRQKRGKLTFALVTVCLRDAGEGIRGIRITLYYGGKTVFGSRRVAAPATDARGCATARFRIGKAVLVFASARVPVRPASGCAPSLAARCTAASIYPPPVRFRAVRIRR